MNKSLLKFFLAIAALSLILSACAPATTPTQAPVQPATEAPQVAPPTEAPAPTPEAPTNLEIWVSGRVTEAGPPPDNWVAY